MEETRTRRPRRYGVVLLILLAVAAAVAVWKTATAPPDLSSSAWLDSYMEKVAAPYKRDFTQSSAFSYQTAGEGKLVLLYASMATVEETRTHYKETRAAAEQGRNDDTALDLLMATDGGDLRLINYFSAVSRIFELELRPDAEKVAELAALAAEAFPEEMVQIALAGTDLAAGAVQGGYVRYLYDDFDPYFRQGAPIHSRAWTYGGGEAGLLAAVETLKGTYPEYSHDKTQNAHYFRLPGGVISLSQPSGQLVAIAIQETPG